MKGSGADKAGIKSGDIITAVNGKKVTSFAQLRAEIATMREGSEVNITVFRDGSYKDFTVKIGKNTEEAEVAATNSKSISPAFEGASFANAKDGGVEVTDVAKGSVAQRFGLRKGDVITAVNRAEIKTISDLKKNLENVKVKISSIRINRNGGTLFITIR